MTIDKSKRSEVLREKLLVFSLDEYYFAISIKATEKVYSSVLYTPVPGTPENVMGVINIRGRVIPVFNIRKIFGLPSKRIQLTDKIVVVKNTDRRLAIIVDHITDLYGSGSFEIVASEEFLEEEASVVDGLSFFKEGMILIYDLDKIISQKEGILLDLALEKYKPKPRMIK